MTPADRILAGLLRSRHVPARLGFFNRLPPGEVHIVGEPEYVGALPPVQTELIVATRRELTVLPADGPSLAEREMAEFGNVVIRRFTDVDDRTDNTIPISEDPVRGELVLVPAREGGFYHVPIEHDSRGWFVRVREDWYRLDVTMGNRNRWVIRELV